MSSSKINLIIFSKNRAAQLCLFLDSIKLHSNNMFDLITVLYHYSSEEFKKGYEKLKTISFGLNIKWIERSENFKNDILTIIDDEQYEIVGFNTDDAIMYRSVNNVNEIKDAITSKKIFAYIPSVGYNSIKSGSARIYFSHPSFTISNNLCLWNWKTVKNIGEFACPFMIAGNLHLRDEILPFLKKLEYKNVGPLESSLQATYQYNHSNRHLVPDIVGCSPYSTIIHSANNTVNTEFLNASGLTYPMNVELLNNLFLQGKRIVPKYEDFRDSINDLHTEINISKYIT